MLVRFIQSRKSPLCIPAIVFSQPLQWHHNERDGVSNPQPNGHLLNRSFRCRSKKTPKLRVTGLCEENSPVTAEFPAQRASNAENVSIWWGHHGKQVPVKYVFIHPFQLVGEDAIGLTYAMQFSTHTEAMMYMFTSSDGGDRCTVQVSL